MKTKIEKALIKAQKERARTLLKSNRAMKMRESIDNMKETFNWNEAEDKQFEEALSEFDLGKVSGYEILHIFSWINGASNIKRKCRIDMSLYNSEEEADKEYFLPRGGRCLGTEHRYVGSVDPALKKWLKRKQGLPIFLKKDKVSSNSSST